jgi:hypothetical protein
VKKTIVKNPVAKNMAKIHKKAGAHGKSEKAKRRTDHVELQTKLIQEIDSDKKNSP